MFQLSFFGSLNGCVPTCPDKLWGWHAIHTTDAPGSWARPSATRKWERERQHSAPMSHLWDFALKAERLTHSTVAELHNFLWVIISERYWKPKLGSSAPKREVHVAVRTKEMTLHHSFCIIDPASLVSMRNCKPCKGINTIIKAISGVAGAYIC